MEEIKVLESALKSCQRLERSLYRSINAVRRLNIRYNVDWLIKNYNSYIASICLQYQCDIEKPRLKIKPALKWSNSSLSLKSNASLLSTTSLAAESRSCYELCGNNRKINYKFLKIKRGMEALLMQLQHTIDIANRQRDIMHLNFNGTKTRICCH